MAAPLYLCPFIDKKHEGALDREGVKKWEQGWQ